LNLGAILIANNLLNHGFRLAESKRQTDLANQSHQHRLKELAHQQQLGHEYRLDEQIQASSLRCREIAWSKHLDAQAQKTAHQYRLKEITWSNELRLHQELRLRQIAQENAIEIEHINFHTIDYYQLGSIYVFSNFYCFTSDSFKTQYKTFF